MGLNTAVTFKITDSDGQTWNNGTYRIFFEPVQGNPGPYVWGGVPFTPAIFSGSLDGTGSVTVNLPSNTDIVPTGSMWRFVVCPESSAACLQNVALVTGVSQNLSSFLSASAVTRFPASESAWGYRDIEVDPIPNPGGSYFNVTDGVLKVWNGFAWITYQTGFNVLFIGGSNPTDLGIQANAAYATLSAGTGSPITGSVPTIQVIPPLDGSAINYSTPIKFDVLGKYVNFDLGGATLNYVPTTATAAITLDYSNAAGSDFTSAHGVSNGLLVNNNGHTTGGTGSLATGIAIGNVNGGAYAATFLELSVCGFGTAFSCTNVATIDLTFLNCTFTANNLVFSMGDINGTHLVGGVIDGNGKVWLQTALTASELYAEAVQFFSSSPDFDYTLGDATHVSIAHFSNCHFEKFGNLNPNLFEGFVNLVIEGGLIEDDSAVGTGNWFISSSGVYLIILGTQITAGRPITQDVLMNAPCRAFIMLIPLSTNVLTIAGGANAAFATVQTIRAASSNAAAPWVIESATQISGGVTIGVGGTALTLAKVYTPALTPASVSAAAVEEQTFAVVGLTTADKIIVNPPAIANATGLAGARVSAADTLAIRFVNPTAGALTPTAGTYTVVALRS